MRVAMGLAINEENREEEEMNSDNENKGKDDQMQQLACKLEKWEK